MASRIGPVPPEKGPSETKSLGQDARVSKGHKVEKLREIDPDEQPRKRFQRALNEAEKQFDDAKGMTQKPSPFDIEAESRKSTTRPLLGAASPKTSEEPEQAPIASPPVYAQSAPSFASREKEEEEPSLPKAPEFWNEIDEPPDQPPSPQKMEEMPQSTLRGLQGEKRKEEPFAEPAGKRFKKEGSEKKPPTPEEVAASLKSKTEHPIKPKSPFSKEAADLQKEKVAPQSEPLSKKEVQVTAGKPETPSSPKAPLSKAQKEEVAKIRSLEERGKQEGEKHKATKRPAEIADPGAPPLPPEVVPLAQIATVRATPYLGPEAIQLFYRMAGMIHVMAGPQGISRTEVVLNSPSFASSRFFGATIVIEKYATAPNAVNIQLSGSNEAVKAFNQNLPSLVAAFDQAKLPLQINRIEAVYSTDRPVFHRKERGGEKGGFEGGSNQKRGG